MSTYKHFNTEHCRAYYAAKTLAKYYNNPEILKLFRKHKYTELQYLLLTLPEPKDSKEAQNTYDILYNYCAKKRR